MCDPNVAAQHAGGGRRGSHVCVAACAAAVLRPLAAGQGRSAAKGGSLRKASNPKATDRLSILFPSQGTTVPAALLSSLDVEGKTGLEWGCGTLRLMMCCSWEASWP